MVYIPTSSGLSNSCETAIMPDAVERDMRERFRDQAVHLHAAYTCSDEEAQAWKLEIEARFPGYAIDMDRLSLSVACHIGPGSLAVACTKVLGNL